MIAQRPFWKNLIEQAWQKKTIIWVRGVRRVGNTSLCQSLDNIEYFDCELPRVQKLLEDPEDFLEGQKGKRIVLDEIHMLENPSSVLKIAADHYPEVKIIATGSSTLGASKKFSDTLTGRKREIWLTPILLHELSYFGNEDIRHRFLYGGLPSLFLEQELPETDFKEWINAYWARDIQDIFTVSKRAAFQKFFELLLTNSGGIFETSKFTVPCEVSRPTIESYLNVLEATFVVHVIRPYSTHKPTEIVKMPKVYGFDTGFVCYAKGRAELRAEDLGFMWEHCVLNEMHGALQKQPIHYWRNRYNYEIDFVVHNRVKNTVTAIECKFNSSSDDSLAGNIGKNFETIRELYPDGENLIVSRNVDTSFRKQYKNITITFVSVAELIKRLTT
jgi:predicted AAA+ superfamily ATPase